MKNVSRNRERSTNEICFFFFFLFLIRAKRFFSFFGFLLSPSFFCFIIGIDAKKKKENRKKNVREYTFAIEEK